MPHSKEKSDIYTVVERNQDLKKNGPEFIFELHIGSYFDSNGFFRKKVVALLLFCWYLWTLTYAPFLAYKTCLIGDVSDGLKKQIENCVPSQGSHCEYYKGELL